VGLNTAMPQQQYSPSDVFPGVHAYHGAPENLTLSSDGSMGHNVHHMGSPVSSVSSGSGPSSPTSTTFAPLNLNCVPADFSYPCDGLGPQAGSFCGSHLDNLPLGCSWDAASAWSNQSQLLAADEFDMSAIPPVELGIPGCGDEMLPCLPSGTFNIGYNSCHYDPMVIESSQYSSDSQNPDTFEQLFNFEGMLAAHHGY